MIRLSRALRPSLCRNPSQSVRTRMFTGYTKEQTKQLFGGILLTVPACGAWYYIRMNMIQPHLDERDKSKEATRKESELAQIAAEDEIKHQAAKKTAAALKAPNTVYIDVRTAEESSAFPFPRPCLNIPCTLNDASLIRANASNLPADRNAPIVVFCRSGMRAARAMTALSRMGYTGVVNGGGAIDLIGMLPKNGASTDLEAVAEAPPRKKWFGLI